ncbi:MAG TPA: peptide chain release factor 1 [Defluviitaleaceae bacterium]|jgi:peptide chain release factor 1|nr:peptide chain release factor 1 [Candidatus Epulonipiscium sp.]HQD51040.1 peptide chain release factor 1 [Defluviitaleaceae bacterium]
MFSKLEEINERYDEISKKISAPEVINNQTEWQSLMKEYGDLKPLVEKYTEYKKVKEAIDEAHQLLEDNLEEDFRQLVKEELAENKQKIVKIEEELKILLLPKDPNDEKNVIVEIRGGAGGDEAALFAGDLFRMYSMYAEKNNWKVEIMDSNEIGVGGFKEIIFMIQGRGAYSKLKYESGVHRVQRIPITESGGRIHTSTVTVAVLPEVEEVDVEINMNDIRVDVFRSSGHGGQSVNTTDSAVRITHLPTNIVVTCQDEKSQLKNKEKALKVLRAKLYEIEREKQEKELAETRRSQVGTGNRNERIRTYNFPQGRVTDHRIGLTLHKLDSILDGDLDEIIDSLIAFDQMERLKKGS